jgi:hypothetical protein
MTDTSHNYDIPRLERHKPCDSCGEPAYWVDSCGAWVCGACRKHHGLCRCWCGWSVTGRDGRIELIEMGENIDYD